MEKNAQTKRQTIPLREKLAIEAVIRRAKREHRTMSSALAVIVYEWTVLKTLAKARIADDRRAKSLPENGQDTGGAVVNQAENLAAALNAATAGTEQPK
jgi:hypothetical protein